MTMKVLKDNEGLGEACIWSKRGIYFLAQFEARILERLFDGIFSDPRVEL